MATNQKSKVIYPKAKIKVRIRYASKFPIEAILGALVALFFFGASGLKLDREYQRGVIFRLGRIKSVKGPGMYWIMPIMDQKAQLDLRTKTVSIEPQETITIELPKN